MAYDASVTLTSPEPNVSDVDAAPPRKAPDEAGPEDAPPPRARRQWPWILLGVVLVFVVAGAIGAVLLVRYLPSAAGERAVASAKERGFDLGFDSIDVTGVLPWEKGPAQIALKGVRAKNVAAPDVQIAMDEVRVTFAGLDPASVEVVAPSVDAPSLPALFAFEDALKGGPARPLPVTATQVRLRVDRVAERLPLAVVGEASRVTAKDGEISIEGLTVKPDIPFVSLGVPAVAVIVERAEDRLWLRFADLKSARLGVNRAATRGYLELDRLDPEKLPKWLPIGLPGKSVSGKLEVGLSGEEAERGSFEAAITGYVPPHPRELQGIIFGNVTKVSGKFAIAGTTVDLEEVSVKAGTLELKGKGSLGLDGTMRLDLKGVVPCNQLAVSAIAAHLGPTASLVAGQLARGRLSGNVETRVTVEADVRDIEKAKVAPSAFVRCSISL